MKALGNAARRGAAGLGEGWALVIMAAAQSTRSWEDYGR
jgi:hypothetical protein